MVVFTTCFKMRLFIKLQTVLHSSRIADWSVVLFFLDRKRAIRYGTFDTILAIQSRSREIFEMDLC